MNHADNQILIFDSLRACTLAMFGAVVALSRNIGSGTSRNEDIAVA